MKYKFYRFLFLIFIILLFLTEVKSFSITGYQVNDCSENCPEIISSSAKHFGSDFLWYGIQEDRANFLNYFSQESKDLNAEIVRYDVYWSLIEPSRGEYDWTLTDNLINSAPANAEIIFTLYSTSPWGSEYNDCREAGMELMELQGYTPNISGPPGSIPESMVDYENFLDAIVNRYKDKVKYWQIENEIYGAKNQIDGCPPVSRFWLGTMDEYIQLLQVSYNKIKQADPSSQVFASGYTFEPWDGDLKQSFKIVLDNAESYSDYWDLHLYLGVPEDPAKISRVKEESAKKLIATETGVIDIGYPAYSKFSGSLNSAEELKLQSQDLVKRYVRAFGEGIEKVFLLRIAPLDFNEAGSNRWAHMSLTFDAAGDEKKPSYYTYQLVYDKLKGFNKIKKLNQGVYKFTVGSEIVIVAWSESGNKDIDLSNNFETSAVRVTHIISELDSNKNPVYKNDEIFKINSVKITSEPVFIEEFEACGNTICELWENCTTCNNDCRNCNPYDVEIPNLFEIEENSSFKNNSYKPESCDDERCDYTNKRYCLEGIWVIAHYCNYCEDSEACNKTENEGINFVFFIVIISLMLISSGVGILLHFRPDIFQNIFFKSTPSSDSGNVQRIPIRMAVAFKVKDFSNTIQYNLIIKNKIRFYMRRGFSKPQIIKRLFEEKFLRSEIERAFYEMGL
jgi:hypothetical protein